MSETLTSKERVLRVFRGEETDRPACFSGMGNVTTEGMKSLGYRFAEVHRDARKLARCAASTPKLFGYDCCVVPFDLAVEAEALGAIMNTYPDSADILYPTIKEKVIRSADDLTLQIPDNLAERGRVPMMKEAIRLAKEEMGDKVPVGSYVLGPFTLAGQIMELNDLLKLSFKKQDQIAGLLDLLSGVIIAVAREYESAGVDYLCVREMGATSDVLSPRAFKNLILPPLKKIFEKIGVPSVLHVCGKTNDIVSFMAESGAAAISVDQKNDVADTRKKLGERAILFGNFDPYNTLVTGTIDQVRQGIRKCLDDGVSAVWPGCDIWPTVPPENFHAMMDEVRNYRRR